ncbi:helix-hairpin-helix domain-containing protein [Natrarchaeobius oligotrophus]|uniref:Helix-hairpin-helix domain-containing protein n=1 Tax=Natrarchaeobius chitinivorans TaxID=1679083 RepID=A0A3N6MH16_NATCH|nr:helix-hairpin-helix domain-containing protein [Natrarchaeobius chitinivorans]RQH03404.1 helix-hairpin-helix domain-containing protein [Natrarchaeobius chitinivorans]
MGILQKLKSLLGLEDSSSQRRGAREVGVTVERERSSDDEASERVRDAPASARLDEDSSEPDETEDGESEPDAAADEEPAAAGTEAAGSTDSLVDPAEDPDRAAEPAEATGPAETDAAPTEEKTVDEGADHVDSVEDDVTGDADAEDVLEGAAESDDGDESDDEDESDDDDEVDETDESEPADGDGEPVNSIKGIGPAYADRLADAGVETVADLAGADAAELAEQTDVSEKRIQGWIDRAEVR